MAVDFTQFEPFALNVTDPNLNAQYVINYNLTMQHQLTHAMVATLSYKVAQHPIRQADEACAIAGTPGKDRARIAPGFQKLATEFDSTAEGTSPQH